MRLYLSERGIESFPSEGSVPFEVSEDGAYFNNDDGDIGVCVEAGKQSVITFIYFREYPDCKFVYHENGEIIIVPEGQ